MATATLGLFVSAAARVANLAAALRPFGDPFRTWTSVVEAAARLPACLTALRQVIAEAVECQQPLILQPVWRSNGAQGLAANAFDVFVWTDFAFLQLVVDQATNDENTHKRAIELVTRPQRAALQIARMLYELSVNGRTFPASVFTEMGYERQTDKSLAVPGKTTIEYLNHPRLLTPSVPRSALPELILGGGFTLLQPEKRLDATIAFTCTDLFPPRGG